jgi:hypothetical protein
MQVSKSDLVKALEFSVSSAFTRPESWMYFNGVYCSDFVPEDEKPSVNDFTSEAYEEWRKYCDIKEDNDENYSLFVKSVKDYYESILVNEIKVNDEYVKIE